MSLGRPGDQYLPTWIVSHEDKLILMLHSFLNLEKYEVPMTFRVKVLFFIVLFTTQEIKFSFKDFLSRFLVFCEFAPNY